MIKNIHKLTMEYSVGLLRQRKPKRREVSIINRVDVIKETLVFLEKNPNTSQMAVNEYIEKSVLDRPEIREIAGTEDLLPLEVYIPEEAKKYLLSKEVRDAVDEVLMLTNEVIWDLIIERVLTPGNCINNKQGISLCVTDPERLMAKLKEMSSIH